MSRKVKEPELLSIKGRGWYVKDVEYGAEDRGRGQAGLEKVVRTDSTVYYLVL